MSKILFVCQSHNIWGGIEHWLEVHSQSLAQHGFDVAWAIVKGAKFNNPDKFLQQRDYIPKEILVVDGRSGTERGRVGALVHACRQANPQLIVPVAVGSTTHAVRALKLSGARFYYVVPIHSFHPGLVENILRFKDQVDHVIVVNRLLSLFFQKACPELSERVTYVRHGVRPPYRARSLRGRGRMRVGIVSRLAQVPKRILDLIDLVKILEIEQIQAEIRVYGDGPDFGRLQEALNQKLEHVGILFFGKVSREVLYSSAYPEMDMLLIFSEDEAGPFCAYEAMGHGVVPVTARYLGQAAEGLLRHGHNCLTFPVGDMPAAVRQVSNLISNPEMLEELSQHAQTSSRIYDEDRMLSDWNFALESVLSREPIWPDVGKLIAPAGWLESIGLPLWFADKLRNMCGRRPMFESGFDEWPGTLPAPPDACADVIQMLQSIEEIEAARMHQVT